MGRIIKLGRPLVLGWRGYLVAIVLVALATWLKYLAQPSIIPADIPILYLLAVVPTAIFFGLGPAILVCILSLLAYDYFFIPPLYTIGPRNIDFVPILVIFLLVGVLFSLMASNLREKNRIAAKEITARKQSEAELARYRDHLEDLVRQRTAELENANRNLSVEIAQRKKTEVDLTKRTLDLETANKELEAFSYSVSHDLRAPLRSMEGFSQAVLEDYGKKLDEQGQDYLKRIRESSQTMAQLIDDILGLSRVVRAEIVLNKVNLSDIARVISRELRRIEPQRQVEFDISDGMKVVGDANFLYSVLQNLLSNAFKFTAGCPVARIIFAASEENGEMVYYVKDNGAGFDMKYADKLFKPFQRLHSADEFPGTGVGLATVQRIIRRHGGKVWAEGHVGNGATFYFTLKEDG